jgi:hypothetical protein
LARLDISTGGEKEFEGENPLRGTAIQFYLKSASEATVSIATQAGQAVCEDSIRASAGINRMQWTLVAPLMTAGGRGGRGGRGRPWTGTGNSDCRQLGNLRGAN